MLDMVVNEEDLRSVLGQTLDCYVTKSHPANTTSHFPLTVTRFSDAHLY